MLTLHYIIHLVYRQMTGQCFYFISWLISRVAFLCSIQFASCRLSYFSLLFHFSIFFENWLAWDMMHEKARRVNFCWASIFESYRIHSVIVQTRRRILSTPVERANEHAIVMYVESPTICWFAVSRRTSATWVLFLSIIFGAKSRLNPFVFTVVYSVSNFFNPSFVLLIQ